MNKFFKWFLIATLQLPLSVYAQDDGNICDQSEGYTVGYFNGVNNTYRTAHETLREIERSVIGGKEFNGEQVTFEVFYNQSSGLLQDLAEVFTQRQTELNGVLENRWFLFWDALKHAMSMGDPSDTASDYESAFTHLGESGRSLLNNVQLAAANSLVSDIFKLARDPDLTSFDLARHNARIKTLVIEKRKLMLIAHSQGNLFVNSAHDTAVQVGGSNKVVQTIHVAPPTTSLRGPYFLSTFDLVINGLRLVHPDIPPPNNVSFPVASVGADITGHGMLQVYLNPSFPALPLITGSVTEGMGRLEASENNGSLGFFSVTLTWNRPGDIDLHAFEPDGVHVYWRSKRGWSVALDVDDRLSTGPEHIFATCSRGDLKLGRYTIGINNYDNAPDTIANVQVSSAKAGVLSSTSLPVGIPLAEMGDRSPRRVIDVIVSENENGELTVTTE